MRVLVFGDSITQGFWDPSGGWVNHLWEHYVNLELKNRTHYEQPTIFNLGISGDDTNKILERFDNETSARVWPNGEFTFLFATGMNDARLDNGQLNSSPGEYRTRLKVLIQKATHFSDKIMFVGFNSCEENLTTPVPWAPNVSYKNEEILKFEKALQEVAAKQGVLYVPVFSKFQQKLSEGKKLLADGLHPNDKGHELIFQLVQPELDKLLSA